MRGASGRSRLGIIESRSWATWHLVLAAFVAAVVGMVIGYSGNRSAAGSAAAATGLVPLQPAATSATTATTDPSSTSSTTSSMVPTSTTAVVDQPMIELVPNSTGAGSSSSITFTAGGPWRIGWAFTCVAAPSGTGSFGISAAGPDAAPISLVQVSRRSGKDTSNGTVTGAVHLTITTDPACRWAVHVVGASG